MDQLENQSQQQNIPQEPQSEIQPEMPQKLGMSIWAVVLITLASVIIVAASGYAVYYYFILNDASEGMPIVYSEDCAWRLDQEVDMCQEDMKYDGMYFNGTECLGISSCSTPFETQESCKSKCVKDLSEGDIEKYKLEVIWTDNLNHLDIECQINNEPKDMCDYYHIGVIKNGILAGKDFYLEVEHEMGDSFRHYTMFDGNQFYFDGYYGDESGNNWEIKKITDLPEEIYFSDTDYKLSKYPYSSYLFSKLEDAEKIFHNNELGDFYLYNKCLLAELPDHRSISYDFLLPFISEEDKILKLTFNNGQRNQDEYLFKALTGCGALCDRLNDVSDEVNQQDLIEIGKVDSGEIFYGLKNPQHKMLTDLYNDNNTQSYYDTDGKFEQLEQNKYTYQEFLLFQPLLFWQSPLGQWIQFKNAKFDTIAEMCKPAIYLYPEETVSFNVQVKPNGGFTGTMPGYPVNGWNVEINPDGTIIDLNTGKKYSYLYWSGIGLNYPTRSNVGWILPKEDIELFLDNKLKILGLNDNEISDFNEYWIDKLNITPYYHIWFMPQDKIDRIAPLSFSPSDPKSIIRVIMNARGLNEYQQMDEQQLPSTPQRNGFTAVEWGGALIR